MTATLAAKASGSTTGTLARRTNRLSSFMIAKPASSPSTVPALASRADCMNTIRSTADVLAPSAILIPISCWRWPKV